MAVMVAVPLVPFAIVGELPGDRWLRGVDDTRGFVIGALGAALLALDVLMPIPSSVVGSLLGARLGFAYGFAFTTLGLIFGHVIGYTLGRVWPRRFRPDVNQPFTLWVVFLSRPVPVLAEAAAIGAGAARLPFWRYLLACLAGDALYAAALCATGAQLLPTNRTAIALVFPMVLPVLTWMVWKLVSRRKKPA